MGKEARRRAEEKLQAGMIPIRFGPKNTAKARKRRARPPTFMPIKKGEKPIRREEVRQSFDAARKVRAEVAEGRRPGGEVDLGEEELDAVAPEFALALADVVMQRTGPRAGNRILGGGIMAPPSVNEDRRSDDR